MLTNWMTTVPGVLALMTVLWNAWQTKTINWEDLQGALVALGLLAAKDWNVTGGSKAQD
jgi:hypothetical protein